jgi:2-keto-3-deoxy-L-fuconate dehydrogenase
LTAAGLRRVDIGAAAGQRADRVVEEQVPGVDRDTGLREQALAELGRAGGIEPRRLDVTDTAAVDALAKELGAVDVLYNCAGYVHHGTVLDCSEKDWDFSFDINVKAMYRTIRAFLPAMLERAAQRSAAGYSASIINISSGASSVRGIPNRYVYGATKAAVIGLTKAVAADYIRKGIRCNAICPGTIQSPSLDERIAAQAKASSSDPKTVRQAFVDRQPMGRLGTPEEVAMLAVYLASDESNFTTGQIHIIDGGFAL